MDWASLLVLWLLASIPAGIFAGNLIRVGSDDRLRGGSGQDDADPLAEDRLTEDGQGEDGACESRAAPAPGPAEHRRSESYLARRQPDPFRASPARRAK